MKIKDLISSGFDENTDIGMDAYFASGKNHEFTFTRNEVGLIAKYLQEQNFSLFNFLMVLDANEYKGLERWKNNNSILQNLGLIEQYILEPSKTLPPGQVFDEIKVFAGVKEAVNGVDQWKCHV